MSSTPRLSNQKIKSTNCWLRRWTRLRQLTTSEKNTCRTLPILSLIITKWPMCQTLAFHAVFKRCFIWELTSFQNIKSQFKRSLMIKRQTWMCLSMNSTMLKSRSSKMLSMLRRPWKRSKTRYLIPSIKWILTLQSCQVAIEAQFKTSLIRLILRFPWVSGGARRT